jgi:hypothetical protein
MSLDKCLDSRRSIRSLQPAFSGSRHEVTLDCDPPPGQRPPF